MVCSFARMWIDGKLCLTLPLSVGPSSAGGSPEKCSWLGVMRSVPGQTCFGDTSWQAVEYSTCLSQRA